MSDQKATMAAAVDSSPYTALLNLIIKKQLPAINSGIAGAIRNGHLDPWGQVHAATDNLGSINLGICHASANASYAIQNMRGLSSFNIQSLVVSETHTDPSDSNKLLGTVNLTAGLSAALSAHVGGAFEAKCGFIHPHVGIGGTATVTGTVAEAVGSFTATLDSSSGKVCLTGIKVSGAAVDYADVKVSIDGLGIFNTFLDPLINLIISAFKGPIRSAISGAVTPIINSQIGGALPQCADL